ncbi:MAG: hypothetical protein ACOYZ7_04995 [Chloroflexota bacterium]
MNRVSIAVFLTLLGLMLGITLGLAVGWLWWPVEYTDAVLTDLSAGYQADYVVMVGDAFALDGDLEAARLRLNRLGAPDLIQLVLARVEAALAVGGPEAQVRRLAQLAAALGASDAALGPYLNPLPAAP